MHARLARTNLDLVHQVTVLQNAISSSDVAPVMEPYLQSVLAMCKGIEHEARRQLTDLTYGLDDTIPDILEATQRAMRLFDWVNVRFAPPIIRYRDEDRLALSVIQWLHESHDSARGKPFAVSDGIFSVYPTPEWPIVYQLPVTRRMTLLFLPFLIHEFGHLLYACHKAEMDELVGEFKQRVARVFSPTTVRDTAQGRYEDGFQRSVADAWYAWTQEVFCDAVGLVVSGESYLKAFSHYFCFRSSEEYYLPRHEQIKRPHPVTRIRTTMLIDRAKKHGFVEAASEVDEIWESAARSLGIREDYEGTWVDELFVPLRKTIDDMLEEASPVSWDAVTDGSPVEQLNEAWQQFEHQGDGFPEWERCAVKDLLAN